MRQNHKLRGASRASLEYEVLSTTLNELDAGLETNAAGGETVYVIGDCRNLPPFDARKKLSIGHERDPLLPRAVAWGEMRFEIEVAPGISPDGGPKVLGHLIRFLPGTAIKLLVLVEIVEPDAAMDRLRIDADPT